MSRDGVRIRSGSPPREPEGWEQAEAALLESEARLRAIVQGTYTFIGLLSPDGTVLESNRAALEFIGADRSEVVGRPFWDTPWWSTAEDRERLREAIGEAARGVFVRMEVEHRNADGRTAVIDFSLAPVLDAEGQVRYLIPEGRDITDRKRAEEALRLSEAKFAGIISVASDAIVSVDESQRVVLFNDGAEQIFGYAAEEVVGRPLDLLLPGPARSAHRADVETFGRSAAPARRMGERGEVRGRRKNGEEFPAEASISKLDLNGVRLYTAVLRDITERKRADEEIRLLQSLTRAVGEAADLDAALSDAMERICRVTGWVAAEAWFPSADGSKLELSPVFFGETPELERFHEKSREVDLPAHGGLPGRVWATKAPIWVQDIAARREYVRADLAREVGLKSAIAIPALADQEVVAVLVFYTFEIRDQDARQIALISALATQLGAIIQRKRIVQALATQAKELERSNAELEQFAFVASHDLQEPLRKIQAFGDRLRSRAADTLDEPALDYLDRMVNASQRMQALIEDLLTFSRVTTQAQPFVRVEPRRVVEQVLQDLEARIEESGAVVEVGPLPALDADPQQLRSLFQNLLGNALKFHAPGATPVVRLRGERLPGSAESGEWVRFTVEDNGIGFDPKYVDRVFGVFQRLHGRDGRYQGTGMGLAICRKIVERHGGTITARSEPDQGATFIVTLPSTHSIRGRAIS